MEQSAITAKDPRATLAIRRWSELKTERARFETDWEDMARLIRPLQGGFGLDNPATRDPEKPLSSAPIVAQSSFAGELYGSASNPANKWMGLRFSDPDLNDHQPFKEWAGKQGQRVLRSFRSSVSSFYPASIQTYADIATFGNAPAYDEMVTSERKIMDVALSLAEVVCDIDAWGRVSEVVRKFHLTPLAAARMFKGADLPPKVIDLAEKGSTDKLSFYHHILRNEEFEKGRIGPKGKRWLSRYATEIDETLIRESGYEEMPFYMARWEVPSGFTYGFGPGFVALASARAVQRMDDATLRAAQFAADPARLAPDQDVWQLNGRIAPGDTIYGGLDMQGRQMLQPMQHSNGIGLTIEEKRQKIEEIKDAFHWTLLSLVGRTGLNELEVMEIQAQRQRLWAPHMGRLQEEYLARKIERRFSLLWRAGQIDPPPDDLPADAAMEVEYTSAAEAAQRSAEAVSTTRFLADAAALAQISPEHAQRVGQRIDPDEMLEVLHEARGAPAGTLRAREVADQIAEAQAQQQQMAQMLAMAQQGGAAMKDMAGAEAALMQADAAEGGGQ